MELALPLSILSTNRPLVFVRLRPLSLFLHSHLTAPLSAFPSIYTAPLVRSGIASHLCYPVSHVPQRLRALVAFFLAVTTTTYHHAALHATSSLMARVPIRLWE